MSLEAAIDLQGLQVEEPDVMVRTGERRVHPIRGYSQAMVPRSFPLPAAYLSSCSQIPQPYPLTQAARQCVPPIGEEGHVQVAKPVAAIKATDHLSGLDVPQQERLGHEPGLLLGYDGSPPAAAKSLFAVRRQSQRVKVLAPWGSLKAAEFSSRLEVPQADPTPRLGRIAAPGGAQSEQGVPTVG
jgi:hypothetical protein